MLRMRALYDDSSSDEDGDFSGPVKQGTTKEAQESEAFSLYNQALGEQRQGELAQAKETLLKLLKSPLIKDAPEVTEGMEISTHPGLLLKYSSLKNLANICVQQDRLDTAMEYYLQAVMVDDSDVTVWYKVGTVALKTHQYSLARHAFEQGLQCNERHWPCLDQVIPVFYALNNYEVCLHYIAKALGRDPAYIKGIAFMERIFSEQPSLRRDSFHVFENCDPAIYDTEVDTDEAEEFVSEALAMRERKRQLAKLPDPPTVTFMQPLTVFSWQCFGQRLIELYDSINTALQARGVTDISIPRVTLGCRVDLSRYVPMNPELPMPHSVAMASQAAPILPQAPLTPPSAGVGGTSPGRAPMFGESPTVFSQERSLRDTDSDNSSVPGKRGPKRKRMLIDDPAGKRRSTRVRNPGGRVKKSEEVNYQELLRRILPPTLLYREEADEEMENAPPQDQPMDLSLSHGADDNPDAPAGGASAWATEHLDVHHFIRTHQSNSGVIDLLNEYLFEVSSKSHCKWPEGLATTYLECYVRLRKHIDYPDFLGKDVPDQRIRDMGLMCVVAGEIQVDKWMNIKNRSSTPTNLTSSPSRSPAMVPLGTDFPGPYLPGDLDYLAGLACFKDIMGDIWRQFAIRVFWLKANLLILQNRIEYGLDCFDRITEYLQVVETSSEAAPYAVTLPNCHRDNVISLENVNKKQQTLKRCQSLEEVQRLYEASEYSRVVDMLLQPFTQHRGKGLEMESSERHAQLLLLQESLLKMHDYKRCLYWGEVALNEALQKFLNALTKSVRDEWASTIVQLFDSLNKCMSSGISVVQSLPGRHLVRLCQNLMRLVEISMESANEISTVMPWILLYKLARSEEAQQNAQKDSSSTPVQEGIPSSIMLLTIAHEYLGRRSWCLNNGGALLLFIIEAFMAELAGCGPDDQHPHSEELEETLVQCFYCLYGYPSKRKPKYLQDHDVVEYQMPLLWEPSIPVFEFFKPKAVPEFDSYKTSTVSAELEDLLRRIVFLIPDKHNPAIHTEPVRAFIEGDLAQPPPTPQVDIPVVKEIYYLLADYYFKNKETQKAIRFYMHDLSVNPERFDSWAGMALARASKLEAKLNSLELKTEAPIQKQASSALRCFTRALDLDDTNSKLWVEQGAIAYQLHSHASKQFKQRHMFPLSEEAAKQAKSFSEFMLTRVELCYNSASECDTDDNEEWLHHYMLGKVAEKMRKPPSIYLDNYKQAAEFLHDYRAKYPRKIPYYTPPHLAVEALEIFFRLHVCVVKVLMRAVDSIDDLPFDLLEEYVKESASSPFMLCVEKKLRRNTDRSEPEDAEFSNPIQGAAPESSTPKRKGKMSLPDHNYSKHKYSSESSEQSSQESLDMSHDSLPLTPGHSMSSPPIIAHTLHFPIAERRNWAEPGRVSTPPGGSRSMPPIFPAERSRNAAPSGEQKFSTSFSMDSILKKDTHTSGESQDNSQSSAPEASKTGESEKTEVSVAMETDIDAMPTLTPGVEVQSDLQPLTVQTEEPTGTSMETDQPPMLSPIEEALASFEREQLKLETEPSDEKQKEAEKPAEVAASGECDKKEAEADSGTSTTKVKEDTDGKNSHDKSAPKVITATDEPEGTEKDKPTEKHETEVVKEEKNEDKNEEKAAKKEEKEVKEKVKDPPLVRYKKLMDACIAAFRVCLSRFPQHYKSLYRLSYIYYHSPHYRDLQISCDLLLSNPQWPQLPHMPCPGLFHDRKISNLFQGLWKIPIEEIDRAGSFSTHLAKPLLLLFDILRDKKDAPMLFSIHHQLAKTPDLGKKYLREVDRDYLSRLAYERCLDALQYQISDMDSHTEPVTRERFILQTYRIWQHGSKKAGFAVRANKLMGLAYKACCNDQVDPHIPILDQAVLYCQQLQISRTAQVTTPGGSTPGMSTPVSQPHGPEGSTFQRQASIGSAVTSDASPSLKRLDPGTITSAVQAQVPRLEVPRPLHSTPSTGFLPRLDLELDSVKKNPAPARSVHSVLPPASSAAKAAADGGIADWEPLDSSLALLADIASVVSTQAPTKPTVTVPTKSVPQKVEPVRHVKLTLSSVLAEGSQMSSGHVKSSSQAHVSQSSAGHVKSSSQTHVSQAHVSQSSSSGHVKSGSQARVSQATGTHAKTVTSVQNPQAWTQLGSQVQTHGAYSKLSLSRPHGAHAETTVTKTYHPAPQKPVPTSTTTTLQNPTVIPGIRPLPGTDPARYGTTSVARATGLVSTATAHHSQPSGASSSDDSDCIILDSDD